MMLGKIRDQSKNPGVIDNSTAHSLLCDVYDECIYHFATTEFTYSMRFQSADNFINEDYFEAKSLHCENPFGESARRNGRRRTNFSAGGERADRATAERDERAASERAAAASHVLDLT
jgi:hypothetical protein